MKIENGRIVEVNDSDLWVYYMSRELDDVYSFDNWLYYMKEAGVKTIEESEGKNEQ